MKVNGSSPEKIPKPFLRCYKIENTLVIEVFDGKKRGTLTVKIPPDELNFQTPDILNFFLRREFGEDIVKKKVSVIIKLLMDLIDKQEKKDG